MSISIQSDSTLPQGYILVDGQRAATISTTALSATLAANTVTTSALVSGAVTTEKIALGAVVTEDLANGAVTAAKMSGGQSGDAPIYGCRAWVNFDGRNSTTLTKSGTVVRGSTNSTITIPSGHGLQPGHVVVISTSVTSSAGLKIVTNVINSTQFTVPNETIPPPGGTPTGTCSFELCVIRGSGNVASVAKLQSTGEYVINFNIAMPDENYVPVSAGSEAISSDTVTGRVNYQFGFNKLINSISTRLQTDRHLGISTQKGTLATAEPEYIYCAIFR
jgi:hypothetical protein